MNKHITNEERAAIEAFQAEQAEQATANKDAERSIEDRYVDAFTDMTEGAQRPDIMQALATLAAFFHNDDPEFITSPDFDGVTGERIEGSDPNNAQFNQKGLMGQLCQQSVWMLEREEKRMGYLKSVAFRARRAHSHSEIDTLALVAAENAYGRCKFVNLPILEDFKTATKAAFVAQFGEDWTRPVKTDNRVTTEQLEDRFAHRKTESRL